MLSSHFETRTMYKLFTCDISVTVAWFSLDPVSAHKEMLLSNDNTTLSSNSYDDHIALGNVGFSRGVHYWEWRIDKYGADCDPSFGVARFDVPKDQRIGNKIL
jgi:tripartite motif-containing protein 9/67